MEALVREMQSPDDGVPVRGQKMFLTTIPSAFTGYDLIEWLMERLSIDDTVEAVHLASLLCQHGYFFPIGDAKLLHVKDDTSLYRFQTPYYWPSQNHVPDSTDYAIYIHKKMVKKKQKQSLEDYELAAYDQLKKTLAAKWDFVEMQAEEQLKNAETSKKCDRLVSESQERAYWRVYRPPPGVANSLESRPAPLRDRSNGPRGRRKCSTARLAAQVQHLAGCLLRARSKVSEVAESLVASHERFVEFDPLLSSVLPSNPWVTDDPTFLELNQPLVECPTEWRVRRWALSMDQMVSDPTGLQELTKCMKKEHSHENIRFWMAVQLLKKAPLSDVKDRVNKIYCEFLRPGAPCEINIDGRTMDRTHEMMKNPTRFTFDAAAGHIYELLLKKDCYPRFLRSEHYNNLLNNAANPTAKRRFFAFSAVGRKKTCSGTDASSTSGGLGRRGVAGSTGDLAVGHGETQQDTVYGADMEDGDSEAQAGGIFLGGSSRPCAISLPKLTLPTSPASTTPTDPASAPATSVVSPSQGFIPAPPRAQLQASAAVSSSAPASPAGDQRLRQPGQPGLVVNKLKKKEKIVRWTRHL